MASKGKLSDVAVVCRWSVEDVATRTRRGGQSSLQTKFEQARAMQRQGNHKGAVKRLRLILGKNPNNPLILNLMSLSLAKTGDVAKARAALEKAVKSDPGHAASWTNLGAMYLNERNLEAAADAFRHLCELTPDTLGGLIKYGDVCLDLDRFEEAERVYQEAATLAPDDANVLFGLAQSKMFLGRWHEGEEVVNRALAIEPGHTYLLSIKALVDLELGHFESVRQLFDFDGLIEMVDFGKPEGLEDMKAFNDALCEHALNHHSIVYEPRGKATLKGYQTSDLTEDEDKGPVALLVTLIEQAVRNYQETHGLDAAHTFLAQRPDRWSIYLWATVLESQGHQAAHFHPSGWLSGVYYARVPDVIASGDENEDGWIEFGRMEKYTKAKAEPVVRTYQPKEGRAVFFPSYLYHLTKPFESDEKRISFAFDIIPAT